MAISWRFYAIFMAVSWRLDLFYSPFPRAQGLESGEPAAGGGGHPPVPLRGGRGAAGAALLGRLAAHDPLRGAAVLQREEGHPREPRGLLSRK